MTQRLTLLRLEKESAELERSPIENALVSRSGTFNFHFCLYKLEGVYSGGFYHGLLELHENYPFRAPKLYFYTPSGRFEVNTPICTSFTHFHQETWTSAWNVRTLIIATVSFMYSDEPSFGCRNESDLVRRTLARQSLQFNLRRPQFVSLFGHKLVPSGENLIELKNMQESRNSQGLSDELIHHENPALAGIEELQLPPAENQQVARVRRIKLMLIVLLLVVAVLASLVL